jgi:L-ascorbate metabolism protein UlaG (beta-lactamase superfamily)
MQDLLRGIAWLGHASFRISNGTVIYIDPWKLAGGPQADVILITHNHHDHLSPEDIARIAGPETRIVCPPVCVGELPGRNVRAVQPGDDVQLGDVSVHVVAAYNTDKPNHPHSAGHVGYVITTAGRSIYHAGDTDVIPEMKAIECDVALLPMGGTYTMNAEQAAEAAAMIHPQIVVPMHWGRLVGSEEDVRRLEALMPEGVQLAVMEAEA